MNINNSNNLDEKSEKTKKTDNSSLKQKFSKDFISYKFREVESKSTFVDGIMKSSDILEVDGLKYDLEKFQIKNDIKYGNLNLSELPIGYLKKQISSEYIKLNNSRNSLRKKILTNYNLGSNNYDKLLEFKVNDLELSDLLEFIKNEKKLDNFLFENLLEKKPLKREGIFPVSIENFNSQEKLNIIENLDEHNKKLVLSALDNLKNLKVNDADLKILFENGIFSELEKKSIVQTFITEISLQKAVDLGFYSENKAKDKKKEILKNLTDLNENSDSFKELLSWADLGDITIYTSDFSSPENIDNLAKEVGFRDFEESFSSIRNSVREEIENNGPGSFDELKQALKDKNTNNKFTNLDKFKKGGILKIITTGASSNDKIEVYFKVQKVDDEDKKLNLFSVGRDGNINLSNHGEGEYSSYTDILNSFSEEKLKIEFFDEDDIKTKLKNPDDDLNSSDLEFLDMSDIENLSEEDRTKYFDYYKNKKQQDLDKLNEEFRLNGSDEKKDPLLFFRIEELEKELNELGEVGDLGNKELLDFLNFEKFLEKIDLEDIDGKNLGFGKGIIIETENGSYEVDDLNKQTGKILLNRASSGKEPLDYESFYLAFKEQKAKRTKKIDSFTEIIDYFKQNSEDKAWENINFDGSNLNVEKKDEEFETENKSNQINFFVSDESNDVIRVNNISSGFVNITFGERKNVSSLDKNDEKYKKDSKDEMVYMETDSVTVSLNEFKNLLNKEKNKFKPSWKTGIKTLKEKGPQGLQNEYRGSFATRLFNRYSIKELLSGGEMFVDSFKEIIKKGNDLHAARAALAMGSILPEEIRADLQIKVEREEGEAMEKELEALGKVDSSVAVSRVKGWLKNKDTAEHKKEAGIIFLVSKYGLLYAKTMGDMKGSFIWYEAFGGRVGDELYNKIKKDSEEGNVPFTEEKLMYVLLNKQCKVGGYNGIKRRGRLYKEYDGKMAGGISDEIEKGSKEAKAMRNFSERNGAAIGEFRGGEFNNGLGKYKEAINRGSSLDQMSELPFAVLFSGACYNLQEEQLEQFKAFTESSFGGLVFTKFLNDKTGMKVFNQTILDLSKKFGDLDPRFKNMYGEAEAIFKNHGKFKDPTMGKNIEKAQDFWKEYGEALTRTMHRLNNQDDKYSKTDKVLMIYKDEFSSYNKTLDSYLGASVFENKDSMNDQFKNKGVSGLSSRVLNEIGRLTPEGTFYHSEPARAILNEITGEIEGTKTKVYSDDLNENRKIQVENISVQLSYIFSYIKNRSNSRFLESVKAGDSQWYDLHRLKIGEYIDDIKPFSIDNFDNLDTPEVRSFLEKVANNILSGDTSTNNEHITLNNVINFSKKQVEDTVEQDEVA